MYDDLNSILYIMGEIHALFFIYCIFHCLPSDATVLSNITAVMMISYSILTVNVESLDDGWYCEPAAQTMVVRIYHQTLWISLVLLFLLLLLSTPLLCWQLLLQNKRAHLWPFYSFAMALIAY